MRLLSEVAGHRDRGGHARRGVQLERGRRIGRASRAALTPVKFQLKWVAQSQFAGLLRGGRPGLLQGPRARRARCCSAARTSTTSRSSRPAAPTSARRGCRACSSRAKAAPTSSRSPRSSSAPGPGWRASRRPTSRPRQRWPARRSAVWLGGNEPELFAALTKAEPRPDQGEHHQAELRHVGAAQGRSRCGAGHDLQRVRPGPRGQEPGHRRALQAGGPQRHRLQRPVGRHGDAPGPDLRHATSGSRPATTPTSRRSSCRRRSRAGSTAATTPRSASTSSSPRARSSAPATRPGR